MADTGATGYDYDDSKDYDLDAKYSPHYGADGKGSRTDSFVWLTSGAI